MTSAVGNKLYVSKCKNMHYKMRRNIAKMWQKCVKKKFKKKIRFLLKYLFRLILTKREGILNRSFDNGRRPLSK